MAEETKSIITVCLLLFAASAFIWPGAYAIYLEQQQRKKELPRFDERQRLARQQAGNHALYVLLGFLVLWAAVNQIGCFAWTDSVLDMALCALLLTWGVWASDCILHDGFTGWKEKNTSNATALVYCTMMLNFVNTFRMSGIVDSWAPFAFAVGNILLLVVVVLYKGQKDRQAGETL